MPFIFYASCIGLSIDYISVKARRRETPTPYMRLFNIDRFDSNSIKAFVYCVWIMAISFFPYCNIDDAIIGL